MRIIPSNFHYSHSHSSPPIYFERPIIPHLVAAKSRREVFSSAIRSRALRRLRPLVSPETRDWSSIGPPLDEPQVKLIWFQVARTMVLGRNSIQETHYDILSVKQEASYEDIRAGYRSAILNSHPDKSQNTSGSGDKFLKVQKAWEVLGDPRSRALYDSALCSARHDTMVAEDISLEDVMAEDAGEVIQLFYQCRCGDYFFVDSLELEKMGYSLQRNGSKISFEVQNALPASLVLPCGSCSLKVRILINSDDFISIGDHH